MMLIALTACGRPEGGSRHGSGAEDAAWTTHIRRVHEALAEKDISGAEWAWHYAYVAALRSRSWEDMVEVGDAALRIGEAAGFRQGSADRARQSYLVALIRARFQESLDGVLRTAQAFAALGDREAVDQSLQIAKGLAARATVTRANLAWSWLTYSSWPKTPKSWNRRGGPRVNDRGWREEGQS
ncbi:MAG: hypothetical protein ACE5I9_05165 [Candidatus Methylomirabilales bacterium]